MTDFDSWERVKLADVADFERAKVGHVYPAGTSILQISATRGQIGYLTIPSAIESKYAAIIPQAGINSRYFNFVLQKNIDEFMNKHATDLNLQLEEIGEFPIEVCNYEAQTKIAKMLTFIDGREKETQDNINSLVGLKQAMLQRMFI